MPGHNNAPIALFIFKRPDHVAAVVRALAEADGFYESDIYVFADGPRDESDLQDVMKARAAVKKCFGGRAHYVDSETNKGLARSIIEGVGALCDKYGKVIVLEDDLVVSKSFIKYMNSALDRYEHDDSVMQISAYMFPIRKGESCDRCSFLPLTTSWGWATWKRAWDMFDPESTGWVELLKDGRRLKLFNIRNSFDFGEMLEDQMMGRSDSWAIRWYLSVFNKAGLVLYPPVSLVSNIGFDGSGTHGWRSSRKSLSQADLPDMIDCVFPEDLSVDEETYNHVARHLKKSAGGARRFYRRARSFLAGHLLGK